MAAFALLSAVVSSACTPLIKDTPRPAASTLQCAREAIAGLPREGSDDYLHCMAAGLIAHRCSVTEAYIASVGKELKDVIGPGAAQWRDWQSDRRGIRCAKGSQDETELRRCCTTRPVDD